MNLAHGFDMIKTILIKVINGDLVYDDKIKFTHLGYQNNHVVEDWEKLLGVKLTERARLVRISKTAKRGYARLLLKKSDFSYGVYCRNGSPSRGISLCASGVNKLMGYRKSKKTAVAWLKAIK